jgi:hypothetical protein
MRKQPATRPIVDIGVTWATEDKDLDRKFLELLNVRLQRHGNYDYALWSSLDLINGLDFKDEIMSNLKQRPFALALVSPAWVASDFVWKFEWPIIQTKTLFAVGIEPIQLRPGRLDHPITKKQIFRYDGIKCFSEMPGRDGQRRFVDAYTEALDNAVDRHFREAA